MHLADIDLDIFLDQICSIDRRPRAPSTMRPWDEDKLRDFLEGQCMLKRGPLRPKGRFIIHHDEAFPILDALSGNGATPLTLTHIDAHSDLGTGFGDASWKDIGGRLLGLAPKQRVGAIPREGMQRLAPSNYLSYALACRWLRSLTYVHHAHGGDDLMPFLFRDFDTGCGAMELRYVPRLDEASSGEELRTLPHVLEPAIPFEKVSVDHYQATEPFDYVILCQSPGYTPVEADVLVSVFQDYVDFDQDDFLGVGLSLHPGAMGGIR
ncbi:MULTISPECIES: UPF0489 family protein [unclassified Ensifer]|uniref:UPF0489 family protein n=1 Tax=unclassified Ensifer TaxID=2633371 RepID=UPI0008139411|nr:MULTISPECIES: UPF0489 family protein [unclassified Ensifer]OCP23609.1 hypothetical protein BC363_24595 [Ensifer sp. LC384]OCP24296.1 hypothetical protein BC361_21075 [Ensifer sp. LC54]